VVQGCFSKYGKHGINRINRSNTYTSTHTHIIFVINLYCLNFVYFIIISELYDLYRLGIPTASYRMLPRRLRNIFIRPPKQATLSHTSDACNSYIILFITK